MTRDARKPQKDWKKIIQKLPKAQRALFDRICCGDDTRVKLPTANALLKKGLIRVIPQKCAIGKGMYLTVTRYDFTLPAHIAWCDLMSEKCEEEE